MSFNLINLAGAAIIILLLIPNIIYAARRESGGGASRGIAAIGEQIGRYTCMAFMILPIFIREFGFKSVGEMLLYIISNVFLIMAYYAFWISYSKKEKKWSAVALAIIPTCIFLLTGAVLRHWILVASAILFGICHIYITWTSK